jgi:hypothetical protein
MLCQTPVVPQTAAVGVDVDRLVTGEEDSGQDALPYSWQRGGPITLASGGSGAKAGKREAGVAHHEELSS